MRDASAADEDWLGARAVSMRMPLARAVSMRMRIHAEPERAPKCFPFAARQLSKFLLLSEVFS
jgi:hypothetical protein